MSCRIVGRNVLVDFGFSLISARLHCPRVLQVRRLLVPIHELEVHWCAKRPEGACAATPPDWIQKRNSKMNALERLYCNWLEWTWSCFSCHCVGGTFCRAQGGMGSDCSICWLPWVGCQQEDVRARQISCLTSIDFTWSYLWNDFWVGLCLERTRTW